MQLNNRILSPIIVVMNRLKYGQKFLLIGLLFLLLTGLTLYLLMSDVEDEIRFAEQEVVGLEYIGHVRQLLEPLQHHRGLTYAYQSGEPAMYSRIDEQRARIDQAIADLDRYLDSNDHLAATKADWEQIRFFWEELLNNQPYLEATENFRLHTILINDILTWMLDIRDESGLKLDPGQQTYLLADTLIGRLPHVLERVAQARGIAMAVAATDHADESKWTQLGIMSGSIRSELLHQSGGTFSKQLASVDDSLQPDTEQWLRSVASFVEMLDNQMLDTQQTNMDPLIVYSSGSAAVLDGYRLFDGGSRLLGDKLQERIHDQRQKKWLVMLSSLACVMLILYCFIAFYQSVIQNVYGLKQAARKVIKGDLTTKVAIHSRDELAQIGAAFNKMVAAFREMLAERERDKSKIEHLAYHDSLTGVPNRVLGYERLQQQLLRAGQSGESFAVMFLDVHRFKSINDTLGHDAGDNLLKAVAERIRSGLRETDTLSRMGGDEFLLVLPEIHDVGEAGAAAEMIFDQLRQPVTINGRELYIAVNVGISLYPDHGNDQETLIKNADTAMYYAKREGKNNFVVFNHGMSKLSDEKLRMEAQLHRALERKEFILEYQPRLDLKSGKVTGAEALIRWMRPGEGIMSPGSFIPIAEENGCITEIGEWVLRSACEQILHWQRQGLPAFVLSINISTVQFEQDEFVSQIRRTIRHYGIDASWLELELTESVVMNQAESTIEKLKQLKELGVCISIDDFGTGFSSLNYLKYFPIDTLKIDRSFIKDIPDGQKDLAITKTIIALGRRLNLKVVAEGVENEEQYEFLKHRRCNEVQGFYVSPPLAANDLGAFVDRAGVI